MTTKDKEPRNVIPLIKEKATRDIIKNQFDKASNLQSQLDRINRLMNEVKEIKNRSDEYLENLKERHEETKKTVTPPLDEEALLKEYKRKQNEMRKTREQNNKNVTRQYNLLRPGRSKSKKSDSEYE